MKTTECAPAGLYIHVPFCRSKCAYCDFYSIADDSQVDAYLDALSREMKFYRDFAPLFDTVYIGGGTPSCLDTRQLAELLKRIRKAFPIAPGAEITVEVNPGDVDTVFMRGLRDAGVNRVSIGVQSFDSSILKSLGRRHNGRESREAVEAARTAGFDNIGIDLIYGVPGQSHELWRETMETALGFNPEHLSCYELTIEEGTPFHRRIERGEFSLPGEDAGIPVFLHDLGFSRTAGVHPLRGVQFRPGDTPSSPGTTTSTGTILPAWASGLQPILSTETGAGGTTAASSSTCGMSTAAAPPWQGKRTSRRRSFDWRPSISASGRNGGSMAPISGSDTASTCSGRKVPPCVAFGMKGS